MKSVVKLWPKEDYVSLLILSIIGFLFFIGIGIYFLYLSFDAPFPQVPFIIAGAIFVTFGVIISRQIYYFNIVSIFENYFEVKSIDGKTQSLVYFNEIISWYEIEYESKHVLYFDLYLCTNSNKYKIKSDYFSNYDEIKSKITHNTIRDTEEETVINNKKEFRLAYGLFAASALLLLIIVPYNLMKNDVTNDDLITIEGIITHNGRISGGGKSSKSIKITLKSYPDFTFGIYGNAYSVAKVKDYSDNVFEDDTLFLEISKVDYQVKLAHTMKPTFLNSSVNYFDIRVYGLRDKNRTYLTYQDYENDAKSDDNPGTWIAGVLGFILFILGLGRVAVARL
jgi:hypothetical protein